MATSLQNRLEGLGLTVGNICCKMKLGTPNINGKLAPPSCVKTDPERAELSSPPTRFFASTQLSHRPLKHLFYGMKRAFLHRSTTAPVV
jgi:hypothetical protein